MVPFSSILGYYNVGTPERQITIAILFIQFSFICQDFATLVVYKYPPNAECTPPHSDFGIWMRNALFHPGHRFHTHNLHCGTESLL